MTRTSPKASRRWPWFLAAVTAFTVGVWMYRAGVEAAASLISATGAGQIVATPVFRQQTPGPSAAEQVLPSTAVPLPVEHLETLIEAGIGADDSEQRSLAILELSQAPVEQSLGGLDRILRDNRDRRSRITALGALMHLPESSTVHERRTQLLDVLSRDADVYVAEAAHAAGAGEVRGM